MNILAGISANRSIDRIMRLVYGLHGISFSDNKVLGYISEVLIIMDVYCWNNALHCIRVSNYSAAAGKWLGLTNREIKILWCAAILHDVGKNNIPLEILDKPVILTKEEYNVIKTHSRKGYEYVRINKMMKEVPEIILHHHERYDGKGYPSGIEGSSIPLLSRIIAVADAFDAMTSERQYRIAISLNSELTELKNGKWTQFDGDVVDRFVDLMERNYLKLREMNILLGLY